MYGLPLRRAAVIADVLLPPYDFFKENIGVYSSIASFIIMVYTILVQYCGN